MNALVIIFTGLVFGLGSVLLVKFGNPGNYGFCAACQLRDIAGALGLHQVATLQYVRPEIIGFILGAFALSRSKGKFQARGGARPLVRFLLGIAMMVGALVFLGCPLRGILRVAGGDLNGITALAGFVCGIMAGIFFLKKGYGLGKADNYESQTGKITGYIAATAALILLVTAAFHADFLNFSVKGPGSQHAPLFASLAAGLLAGAMASQVKMCLSGGVRNWILVRDAFLLKIYAVMFLAALAANLYFGFFKLGFYDQPLAHTMHLWNFLGLFLTGMAAILAGGCPLRQMIMSGEGNTDAMFCVFGMLTGAGLAHRLNAAGSATGVGLNGQIAVIVCILLVAVIGWFYRQKSTNLQV